MITVLCFLWLGLMDGSSSEVLMEQVSGGSVTLLPKYFGEPSEISWFVGGYIFADIKLDKAVYFYPRFHQLKDRTAINISTGQMTIRNLREEDSGNYRAEAVVNNMDQITRIWLIVAAHPAEVVEEPSGSNVALAARYSGAPTEVSWWRGLRLLLHAQLQPSAHITFYSLRGRADINPSTGQLTISRLCMLDAAEYRAEALVNGTNQYTLVTLAVTEGRGLGAGAIAGIAAASFVVPVILFILVCKYRRTVTRSRCPPVILVSARGNIGISSEANSREPKIWHCECEMSHRGCEKMPGEC